MGHKNKNQIGKNQVANKEPRVLVVTHVGRQHDISRTCIEKEAPRDQVSDSKRFLNLDLLDTPSGLCSASCLIMEAVEGWGLRNP